MSEKSFEIYVKRVLALSAFVSVMLIPSVAHAEPEDLLVNGALQIWGFFEPSLVPFKGQWGDWGYALSIFISLTTLFGLWKLPEDTRHKMGRVSGILVLPIAFLILWMIIGMVWGMITGAIQGGISSFWGSIPGINYFPNLVAWLSKWSWKIAFIYLIFKVAMYVIGNLGSIAQQIGQMIKTILIGPLQGNVTGGHMFLGCILGVMILNRPDLNEILFHVPMAAGVAFGGYQFATKTVLGRGAAGKIKGKTMREPLPDGSWYCDNHGRRPGYSKKKWDNGVKEPTIVAGEQQYEENYGCGFLNPPENDTCGDDHCDRKKFCTDWVCACNYAGEATIKPITVEGSDRTTEKTIPPSGISWKISNCPKCSRLKPAEPWCCTKCAHYGAEGEGIPWDTLECPVCDAPRPTHPTSPLHFPWEDKFQSVEATPPPPTPELPSAQQPIGLLPEQRVAGLLQSPGLSQAPDYQHPPPQRVDTSSIELDTDDGDILTGVNQWVSACPKCGTTRALNSGSRGCTHCGLHFSAGLAKAKAKPATQEPKRAQARPKLSHHVKRSRKRRRPWKHKS